MRRLLSLFKKKRVDYLFVLERPGISHWRPEVFVRTAGFERGVFSKLEQRFSDGGNTVGRPRNVVLSVFALDPGRTFCRRAFVQAERSGSLSAKVAATLAPYKDETLSETCSAYANSYRHALNLQDEKRIALYRCLLKACLFYPAAAARKPLGKDALKAQQRLAADSERLSDTVRKMTAYYRKTRDFEGMALVRSFAPGGDVDALLYGRLPSRTDTVRAVLLGWRVSDLGAAEISPEGVEQALRKMDAQSVRDCRLIRGSVREVLARLGENPGKIDPDGRPLQPVVVLLSLKKEGAVGQNKAFQKGLSVAVTDPGRFLKDHADPVHPVQSITATVKARAAHNLYTMGGAEALYSANARAPFVNPLNADEFYEKKPNADSLEKMVFWQTAVRKQYAHRFDLDHLFPKKANGYCPGYWLCRSSAPLSGTPQGLAASAMNAVAAVERSIADGQRFMDFFKKNGIRFCRDVDTLILAIDLELGHAESDTGLMVLAEQHNDRLDQARSINLTAELQFFQYCRGRKTSARQRHACWWELEAALARKDLFRDLALWRKPEKREAPVG